METVGTYCGQGRKWASTDLATTTYSVTIGMAADDPATAPIRSATRAILDLAPPAGGETSSNILHCFPVLTGANNAVITGARVYGWRLCTDGISGTLKGAWYPTLLFELGMVAGNIAGPAGTVLANYFAMDTITMIIPAAAPNWVEIFSPVAVTADLPGSFWFDARGFQKVEIVVDLGANATGFNVLVAGL